MSSKPSNADQEFGALKVALAELENAQLALTRIQRGFLANGKYLTAKARREIENDPLKKAEYDALLPAAEESVRSAQRRVDQLTGMVSTDASEIESSEQAKTTSESSANVKGAQLPNPSSTAVVSTSISSEETIRCANAVLTVGGDLISISFKDSRYDVSFRPSDLVEITRDHRVIKFKFKKDSAPIRADPTKRYRAVTTSSLRVPANRLRALAERVEAQIPPENLEIGKLERDEDGTQYTETGRLSLSQKVAEANRVALESAAQSGNKGNLGLMEQLESGYFKTACAEGSALEIYQGQITITRNSSLAKNLHNGESEVSFHISELSGTRIGNAKTIRPGYLTFVLLDDGPQKRPEESYKALRSDPHTVLFLSANQPRFQTIAQFILGRIQQMNGGEATQTVGLGAGATTSNAPPDPPMEVADELRKLADLRNAGVLSEDEFNEEKSRLLGISPDDNQAILEALPHSSESEDAGRTGPKERASGLSSVAVRPHSVVIDELSKIATLKEQGVLPGDQGFPGHRPSGVADLDGNLAA